MAHRSCVAATSIGPLTFITVVIRKKWEYNDEVRQLFIDFKKAYDSVRREVLYKILLEFGIPRKLVRLIKIGLKHIAEFG